MGQATKFQPVIENYHGTIVEDTYRYLEDPSDGDVKNWVDRQNEATGVFLGNQEMKPEIKEKLTALWNYEKYTVPQKEGDYYYFHKNDGLQNQAVFYRTKDLSFENIEVVLDPNQLNEKGTAALTNLTFTKDGERLAYGLSIDGSDWQEIRIRNLETGKDELETIQWCKFSSIAWDKEGTGFYYNRFRDPATVTPGEESFYNSVYWHTVGTPQSDDTLIYEDLDNKELAFNPAYSDDYRYLILTAWKGTENKTRVYYRDEHEKDGFIPLLTDDDGEYGFIGNDGTTFYFTTNFNAPKEKIIAIDIEKPDKDKWVDMVAEQADVISFVKFVNAQFVVGYLHNAYNQLKIYGVDGAFKQDIQLPKYVSLTGLTGKKSGIEMLIGYTSYLAPANIMKYDFTSNKLEMILENTDVFPTEKFETTQVFYPSKDGTKIPMFLTHKKGLDLNGENPVLLYGYGGFNVSLTPSFSPAQRMWIEAGGVYAVANLRGGGEFGEAWYKAGTLAQKQNVFDDFIAAAEWLIAENYTSTSKIAIMGGSNGGLLVAACMTQRPDLYGAVICQVPVIDMLRYHKFTVGRYWVTDYGNAEENAEDFAFMYRYSPLHNVKKGTQYPPTLITTADTDDRVVPLHAKKFAATLQAAQEGENPILLRVEKNAGHGLGKPTHKIIEETTDIFTFLFKNLAVRL